MCLNGLCLSLHQFAQDPIKRRQRGSSEELNRGRLNLPLLRSMLEDSRHPKVWNKGDPDVKSLAERHDFLDKYSAIDVTLQPEQ